LCYEFVGRFDISMLPREKKKTGKKLWPVCTTYFHHITLGDLMI
jgi:hypothetical protein